MSRHDERSDPATSARSSETVYGFGGVTLGTARGYIRVILSRDGKVSGNRCQGKCRCLVSGVGCQGPEPHLTPGTWHLTPFLTDTSHLIPSTALDRPRERNRQHQKCRHLDFRVAPVVFEKAGDEEGRPGEERGGEERGAVGRLLAA